ncbi:MAG: Asp-tRNA(Asn)/Glu-tRNA(Gln) amidotransferase subunit GatB [Rhizobiales bacterium]|nr:Asp-tRNA(Asn)/Glu-tRNA(Gln) amidotransferase subunit GatB [Hyphomicrobiales bacterium]NRB14862.1 Asp-tRNA(Asn)/Glu-tRNA(Gln) amidotransferase subunit GatB [Hyphomicrobiales bacterium]
MSYIQGATGDWEIVMGLEIHAQISSNSKLMSGAATTFGAEPNSQVSLVDAAMPGMLPVVNEFCYRQAVLTGLGLNAEINLVSIFDRKNYFYPDLPQGYQISQFTDPIVGKGIVTIELADGSTHDIGIERLHLEQDAGKSIHDLYPNQSCVDLNRSGVALMEIVSDPDMRTAEQAKLYVTKIRTILRYLGTCDGNMEQGSLRADVNVSVRRPGAELGTRCEIKNMNSIRNIGMAIEYEARRQVDLIEDGGVITQETRLWDVAKGETRSMRSKEEAHDYRYFPDPDLLPVVLEQSFVDAIKATIPELPDQKHERLMSQYGLNSYDANILVAAPENADYFEIVAKGVDAKLAVNWVTGDLFGMLNKQGYTIATSPINAEALGELVGLVTDKTVSNKIAKQVFEIMLKTGEGAAKIVEDQGLKQVTDTGAIEKAVDQVIAANPDKVEQAIAKPKMAGWFVGQVMQATGGKANPQAVSDLVKSKLGLD